MFLLYCSCVFEYLRGLVARLLLRRQGLPLRAQNLGQLHHLGLRVGSLDLRTLGVAEVHVVAEGALGRIGVLGGLGRLAAALALARDGGARANGVALKGRNTRL